MEVEDLRKSYGSVGGRDISFYVEAGGCLPSGLTARGRQLINVICTFQTRRRQSKRKRLSAGQRRQCHPQIYRRRIWTTCSTICSRWKKPRCRGAPLYGLSGKALTEAVKRAMAEVEITDSQSALTASCRAVSAAAATSPAPLSTPPKFSSLTNLPPALTPRPESWCGNNP